MLSLFLLLAAAATPDARLVCSVDEQLVVVASETGARKPVDQQPPEPAVALGTAGDTLVGVSSSGAVLQLRDGQWREATRLGGKGTQDRPLRIDSRYPQWATIWLRGDDPGTIPGAGGPPKELVFNEPSPWGGRLVAAAGSAEGDLPSGPLVHVGADGKARELAFEGQKLDFKGAVGYGPGQVLLIDGAAAGAGRRVLLASPDGRVRAVRGVEPPCAWWPAAASR